MRVICGNDCSDRKAAMGTTEFNPAFPHSAFSHQMAHFRSQRNPQNALIFILIFQHHSLVVLAPPSLVWPPFPWVVRWPHDFGENIFRSSYRPEVSKVVGTWYDEPGASLPTHSVESARIFPPSTLSKFWTRSSSIRDEIFDRWRLAHYSVFVVPIKILDKMWLTGWTFGSIHPRSG